MFELSDFYGYCQKNHVDVIPYMGCPQPAATIRDLEDYAVFLDFSKITSTTLLRGICYHELGHIATGALHKVDSPYELVERSEYRANRWAAQHYLTDEDFREAFSYGYTESWRLSEYFNLPQREIESAYKYWTVSRGVDFSK